MTSPPCAQEFEKTYNDLLNSAARLDMLRRLEGAPWAPLLLPAGTTPRVRLDIGV